MMFSAFSAFLPRSFPVTYSHNNNGATITAYTICCH